MTVVAVLGVKGGTGATQWCADVWRAHPGAVAVDLDTAGGDLADRLGADPRTTTAELAAAGTAALHADHVRAALVAVGHGAVLASPSEPELVDLVGADLSGAVVSCCRTLASVVVVDLGNRLDPGGLGALRAADELVLVARADQVGQVRVRRVVSLLARAGVDLRVAVIAPQVSRREAADFAQRCGVRLADPPFASPGSLPDRLSAALRDRWSAGGTSRPGSTGARG